jgi:hypothetical protein
LYDPSSGLSSLALTIFGDGGYVDDRQLAADD